MLARRSFLAGSLKAAVLGTIAAPAIALAQSDAAAPSFVTAPASTGSPRTRGPGRGTRSVTAPADEPRAIRFSGSPSSRGRRRLGIADETVAGAASLR